MMLALLTLIVMGAVAYANGANDVSKGVATLVGSRTASYRRALMWGTGWTVAGALVALVGSAGLVSTFGTALVDGEIARSPWLPLSVAAGAFGWVMLASRSGLPVSTTHALTGAIVGAAMMAAGTATVRWPLLAAIVALPLAVSPLMSAALAYVVRSAFAKTASAPRSSLIDAAHWAASAALSFARGLNDTPKITALGVAAAATGTPAVGLFWFCAAGIGLGGYVSWSRVTVTLAEHITDIEPLPGLVASGVASGLVLAASFLALPVSTTHVSNGAIIGVGLCGGGASVRWRTVREIAAAWLITLPVSAAMGATAWRMLETIR